MELKRRPGFTLVELLVVIIVIGILSSMMMLTLGDVTDKAEATKIVADLRTVKTAALMFYADQIGVDTEALPTKDDLERYLDSPLNSHYPDTDLVTSVELSTGGTGYFLQYDATGHGSGVRERLTSLAETNGLYRVPSGTMNWPPSDGDFYAGGEETLCVRIR